MRLVRSILSIGQPFEESLELTAEGQPLPCLLLCDFDKERDRAQGHAEP
jgi:hypothetical protein